MSEATDRVAVFTAAALGHPEPEPASRWTRITTRTRLWIMCPHGGLVELGMAA